jgi:tetratricopeptide (TPR) repeat protein
MVAASAYLIDKQLDLFEHQAQQAIALAPYDAEILATLAYMIANSGDWQRGADLAKKAYALNPDATFGWYEPTLYLAYYIMGDYERALELARQNRDKSTYTYIEFIPIYGQLGRKQEALEIWRKLLAEDPSWTAESFENWYRMWNMRDEDIAKFMDGVSKSGVLGVEAKPGK